MTNQYPDPIVPNQQSSYMNWRRNSQAEVLPIGQISLSQTKDEKVETWFDKLQQKIAFDDQENAKMLLNETKKDRQSDISSINPLLINSLHEKTHEEHGKDDHMRNQAAKIEADRQSVDELVKSSNRCIINISSGYAWSLFPTTINVEESRITFIFRQLFSTQSHSVDIKDISNVFIQSSFFFATLQIVSKTYVQNDIKVDTLDRKKAIKVRMIIEGLRTLSAHNLNTSSYSVNELISKIEEMHLSQGGEIR